MKKLILLLLLLPISGFANDTIDSIRADRVNACERAYNEYQEHIQDRYIHWDQDPVVRCATYMHLVFAYESGFWTSNKCVKKNNCFWIKKPTYDFAKDDIQYTVWAGRFLQFDNWQDWNLAFARLYYRFHMNKTINQFVYGWSMTDRWTYISFMKERYWDTYDLYYNLINNK